MDDAIAIGAVILVFAALAQGIRIGLTSGDWSMLIPVGLIAALLFYAVLFVDLSSG